MSSFPAPDTACNVVYTTLFKPQIRFTGLKRFTAEMVEQLGFAIIFSFLVRILWFTPYAINGISWFFLKKEELSITTAPPCTNKGTYLAEISLSVQKIAKANPLQLSFVNDCTVKIFPLNKILEPTLLGEEKTLTSKG